jgi:hypothetical protein
LLETFVGRGAAGALAAAGEATGDSDATGDGDAVTGEGPEASGDEVSAGSAAVGVDGGGGAAGGLEVQASSSKPAAVAPQRASNLLLEIRLIGGAILFERGSVSNDIARSSPSADGPSRR